MTGRMLFWTLATAVAVVFQTAPRPPADLAAGCPESIARLSKPLVHGRGPDVVLTCRGWPGAGVAASSASADVLVRNAAPRLDDPCEDQHYYRVTFIEDANGVTALFRIAGGTSTGSARLTSEESRMILSADAYVTDVQLGTYVPSPNGGHAALACRLDPTYHVYCPATRGVDQFCLTFVRRSRDEP